MRAFLSAGAKGHEAMRIETVPAPKAGPGNVVVEVAACGLNYPDVLLVDDAYQERPPRPFAPGAEISGRVVEVGAGVAGLGVGTRVACRLGWGGLAEFVEAEAGRCVPFPDGISYIDAASFLFTYTTVAHALAERCLLRPRENLLVLGAGGGIGTAAIDLGKAYGAQVFAAASSPAKLELALRLGCRDGLIYPSALQEDAEVRALAQRFKEMLGPRLADVVLDPVGGLYSEAALRAIAPRGRLGVVGFTAGIPRIALNLVLLKSCQIVGVNLRSCALESPDGARQLAVDLFAMYAAGRLSPAPTEAVPFEDAAQAIGRISRREVTGKIAVRIGDIA